MYEAVCLRVLDRLRYLEPPVLHVGSLALGRAPKHYGDIHLLVHEDHLAGFRQAMERPLRGDPGLQLVEWNYRWGHPRPAAPAAWGRLSRQPLPRTPGMGYSDGTGAGAVWIQFFTSWRHGPLLLVDLEDWFGAAVSKTVNLLGSRRRIKMPPFWALLLWQASLVTTCAADQAECAVLEAELARLHEIAGELSTPEWRQVIHKAQDYDSEYLCRLDRIKSTIRTYAARCRVPPGKPPLRHQRLIAPSHGVPAHVRRAVLDYGVLYDLRYALEALRMAYPTSHSVPDHVRRGSRRGTGARPRKIWDYPGGGAPASVGELGVADAGFGIHQQIGAARAELSWAHLESLGKVEVEITHAPPQGYWSAVTSPPPFGGVFP